MRKNLPVTAVEHVMQDDQMIVSRTDLKGQITYVNRDFLEISGFAEQELIGAPHNLVRHPDMPPEAFDDLWKTLKAGRPWIGLVKNRCKNGDFYWVEAHVTPLTENGRVTGYMSVRKKPTREQVDTATRTYARFRAGEAHGLAVHRGGVVKTGFLQRLNLLRRTSLKGAIIAAVAGTAFALAVVGWLGVHHVSLANQAAGAAGGTGIASAAMQIGAAILIALGLASFSGWAILRRVIGPLAIVQKVFSRLEQGNYGNAVDITRDDEIGQVLQALECMQTKLGNEVAENRRIGEENLRVRSALDKATVPVTVSTDGNLLVYMNEAARALWREMAPEIRRRAPDFDPDSMLGGTIGQYLEDDETRSAFAGRLSATTTKDFRLAGRYIRITASPVLDPNGAYRGRVTQWLDRTGEIAVEEEVSRIVSGAAAGQFDRRISVTGQQGFLADLGNGLNRLIDIVSSGLGDIARVLNSVAQGDLTQQITADYAGTFGQLKEDTNATVSRLKEVVGRKKEATEAINTAAGEIAAGNSDLSGRTEEQASSLE
ncbi:MAG: PAS domain-containing methyl-accepting chemotaxis protein, partial [Rhodocyclaceae bacterium]